MYEELVKRLHERMALTTAGSPLQDDLLQAADAIEKLTAFAHYVAKEVAYDDYVRNHLAFREIIFRKLYKLGIVETDGEFWSYESPEE